MYFFFCPLMLFSPDLALIPFFFCRLLSLCTVIESCPVRHLPPACGMRCHISEDGGNKRERGKEGMHQRVNNGATSRGWRKEELRRLSAGGFALTTAAPSSPSTADMNLLTSFFFFAFPLALLLSWRRITNPREMCSCRKIATSVVPSFVVWPSRKQQHRCCYDYHWRIASAAVALFHVLLERWNQEGLPVVPVCAKDEKLCTRVCSNYGKSLILPCVRMCCRALRLTFFFPSFPFCVDSVASSVLFIPPPSPYCPSDVCVPSSACVCVCLSVLSSVPYVVPRRTCAVF